MCRAFERITVTITINNVLKFVSYDVCFIVILPVPRIVSREERRQKREEIRERDKIQEIRDKREERREKREEGMIIEVKSENEMLKREMIGVK